MRNSFFKTLAILAVCGGAWSCNQASSPQEQKTEASTQQYTSKTASEKLKTYVSFKLTTDLSQLSDKEKQMIPLLIEAAKRMDDLYWKQSYGDKNELLSKISDADTKRFAEINYGAWDRLDNNIPFLDGFASKPDGANFYPADMTKEEFEKFESQDKTSLYTILVRDENKNLKTIPYSEAFKEELSQTADLLRKAADLAEDAGFKKYLTLRADALLSNQYFDSDIAWMDMRTNTLDIIIGPIETYEDHLFGYKAAFASYILVKDKEWSKRLERYGKLLPKLQEGLPVDKKYKQEKPGSDSQLNAYDVIYYAGDCNSGSKTIAVNLPNDEKVQLEKGTRRSQLKNAMKAKFDAILVPIADQLISPSQRKHITFDAFFANTMFHEVAHGLGIKNTINGKGTVTQSLKDKASALEEGKADILGLYMVTELRKMNEVTEGELMDNYVTFLAGIFRSVRFGAASAHGQANMVRFNFFKQMGAFTKEADGTYKVNADKMKLAVEALSKKILTLQGDGDYDGVQKLVTEMGNIDADLQKDLDKLKAAQIPVDIVFEQGVDVLGLKTN